MFCMTLPADLVKILDQTVGLGTGLVIIIGIITLSAKWIDSERKRKKENETEAISRYEKDRKLQEMESSFLKFQQQLAEQQKNDEEMRKAIFDSIQSFDDKLGRVFESLEEHQNTITTVCKSLNDEIEHRKNESKVTNDKLNTLIDADVQNIRFTMIEAYEKYCINKEPLDILTAKTLHNLYTRYTEKENKNSFVKKLWGSISKVEIKKMDDFDTMAIEIDADSNE